MEKKWLLKPQYPEQEQVLAGALRIHPLLCRLLAQRNIRDFEGAKYYFRPSVEDFHDPFLMKDMGLAVERILRALQSGERILVYGDYDVDGTTAVAMACSFLNPLTQNLDYYVPDRFREGYGISRAGLDYARQNQIGLMIALDCGIKAQQEVLAAREQGLDIIICDHHLPDAWLPEAAAILNPKQASCPYPYKELSGCGIGFKLITALANSLGMPLSSCLAYLDLVATSIAADMVPLDGENRSLAYLGLKKANENPSPGIAALKRSAGLNKDMGIRDLAFMIAPRVNAAGRMDDARAAIRLFMEQDPEKARVLADILGDKNENRKQVDEGMTNQALEMLLQDPERITRRTTVLFRPDWHKGVVGIVASRLMETYYRPTVLLTRSEGRITGSARSVEGFDLYQALLSCREFLQTFGGHKAAAGLTLKPEALDQFREKFEEVVGSSILPDQLVPVIRVDAELPFRDITLAFFRILNQMEPYGPANPEPVFLARKARDGGYSVILRQKHIRFDLVQPDGSHLNGIGFNLAEKWPVITEKKPFDLCFSLEQNDYQGVRTIRARVLDIRSPE